MFTLKKKVAIFAWDKKSQNICTFYVENTDLHPFLTHAVVRFQRRAFEAASSCFAPFSVEPVAKITVLTA